MKELPPKQQPYLMVLKSADDLSSERILVDPNTIDASGKTTIDWYRPSRDGKLVAVDGPAKIATFERKDADGTPKLVQRQFDMLHAVPAQAPPITWENFRPGT